ncbi:phosphatidylinositol 4-phosphate 5-kinase-like protein 1 isoform X1 [Antechinus flavipes]|uniref:phosphatidylinositol 4-phosphate 5-kinase-like protein 1 isoform X1 n=1 Tax=Antechinus flavipes TaxID=38775 RepID=UPI002235BCD9|nr:phosphatidylinositol 4-phosphate 5-kinase-like protein 1 isoform X1 [Antechinus flavipes]XP_051836025.1 phosphatidylinositol 4-phosphate 5-kinase-like protein 1 isoform X1 [Antechinus flavipes]
MCRSSSGGLTRPCPRSTPQNRNEQFWHLIQTGTTIFRTKVANSQGSPTQTLKSSPGYPCACPQESSASNRSGYPNSPQNSSVFRRFLWRIRERWKLLGLFEIDSGHEHYQLTCMIKEGLHHAIQLSIDHPSRKPLKEEDYSSVVTQTHEGFEMDTIAGPVFAHFRHFLGLAEKDYQNSLSSKSCFLQFISNSKSKANFFLTNDKRFFLKTQEKREIQFLLSKLALYIHHLHEYPHSLLVKFLGIHSIKIARGKKKYFIIMQSVFYPDERISERYDIKGCQLSRWTEPLPAESQIILVLKDLNFEGRIISLGSHRNWFLKQIELDTAFLRDLNVLDYSLLVAFQKLHSDEKQQSKNILTRIARSVHGAWGEASTMPYMDSETLTKHLRYHPPVSINKKGSYNLRAHNCRLLPDAHNALHTLDGPEHRYFIGIIDFFTVYNLRKRIEFLWKSLLHPTRTFSTVNPAHYASRLCRWVDAHTV